MSQSNSCKVKEKSNHILSDKFMANLLSEDSKENATVISSEDTIDDTKNNIDNSISSKTVKSEIELTCNAITISAKECPEVNFETSTFLKSLQNNESLNEKLDINHSMNSKTAEKVSRGMDATGKDICNPLVKFVVEIQGNDITDIDLKTEKIVVKSENHQSNVPEEMSEIQEISVGLNVAAKDINNSLVDSVTEIHKVDMSGKTGEIVVNGKSHKEIFLTEKSEQNFLKIDCSDEEIQDPVIKPVAEIQWDEYLGLKTGENSVNGVHSKDAFQIETVVEDCVNRTNADLQNYRSEYLLDDDDDSSSTFSLNSSSDCSDSFLDRMHRSPAVTKIHPVKTRGELDIDELPPIDDLHITLLEREMEKVGTIYAIVDKLVIVRALKDLQALDLNSVLFLSHENPLGRIFDVFGPVIEPFYSVRFNNPEHIVQKGVLIDEDVFFAPKKKDITMYVFVDQLRQQKGSDASWKDNNEPPDEFLDYSDDEQERAAKMKRRAKNRTFDAKEEDDDDVQVIPHKVPNTRTKQDTPSPPVWLNPPNLNNISQSSGTPLYKNVFSQVYPGASTVKKFSLSNTNTSNSGMSQKFSSYSEGQHSPILTRSPILFSNQQPFGHQNMAPRSYHMVSPAIRSPLLNFAPPPSILLVPQQNIPSHSPPPFLQSPNPLLIRNQFPPQSPSPLAFQQFNTIQHHVPVFAPATSMYQQPIFGQVPVLGPASPALHPQRATHQPLMRMSVPQSLGVRQSQNLTNSCWQTPQPMIPPNAPLSVHIPQSPSQSPGPYVPHQSNHFMVPPPNNFPHNGYRR